MSNTIQDTVMHLWTSGRRTKPSNNWITGDAPCCVHNGNSVDRRKRGHLKVEGDGTIFWGCFNCGYKTTYVPGQQVSYKFRKLLSWMGASESEIHLIVFEALREREKSDLLGILRPPPVKEELKVSFKKMALPAESCSIMGLAAFYALQSPEKQQFPDEFIDVVQYVSDRLIDLNKYDLHWSPNKVGRINKRVIIPYLWKGEIVGYASRAIDNKVKPKYLSEIDSGFVFNMDMQTDDKQFVLVMEGPFDAMSVDGVAVLHGSLSNQQIAMIESLDREIIVVPDFEKSGGDLVRVAMEQGWSVSFPQWAEQVKDVNQAITKYGRLFTMKNIVDNVESKKLKIDLLWRQYGR